MTEKLYYKDAYIKEFTASVISSEPCDGGFDTVLDKTAFFPEEGGQYSDKGYINGIRITDVREISGVIHHYSEEQVGITENAVCKIDFEVRYEKMQSRKSHGYFHIEICTKLRKSSDQKNDQSYHQCKKGSHCKRSFCCFISFNNYQM